MAQTYDQFFHDLAVRESVGVFDPSASPNYQALGDGGLNYLGAYQFNEWTMINLGYYKVDSNPDVNTWESAFFTGKDGINNIQDYLNNPAVQDKAAHDWMNDWVWGFVKSYGLDHYIGQNIDGINITASGLLAGAHLRGADAVQTFITSGGANDPQDPYGTPVSQYLSHFSGYQTPFDGGGASTEPAPAAVSTAISVAAPTATPADNSIILNVSADNWNGSPQFLVSVDGVQLGGVQTTSASHTDGQSDAVTLADIVGTGPHDVAVTFLNDAYGGTPDTDRNLYIDSADYQGHHSGSVATALYSAGTVHVTVGATTTN